MRACLGCFTMSSFTSSLMLSEGLLTSFFAAATGMFQNDLKKVIAYSACSQLGYICINRADIINAIKNTVNVRRLIEVFQTLVQ